nr:MAG TPA: hypothetical protein [Caudoviricetes sp.]
MILGGVKVLYKNGLFSTSSNMNTTKRIDDFK